MGTDMKRVHLFELYQCGGAVKILGRMTPETKPSDLQADLYVVDSWLKWLLDKNRDHIPIHDARDDAEKLRQFIAAFLRLPEGEAIGTTKYQLLQAVFARFESILDAELGKLPVYYITRLLGYDTDILLGNGRAVLTQSTLDWLPEEAATGFDEGARSLVLKQATAAGFLLLRAVEDVMHNYYDVLSNGAPRPARRNMGDYIDALEKIPSVSLEMLEVLRSIKNLRRNPLMHPEHRLEMDDAVATFDVAKSAISAMARQAREHSSKPAP
jgi:hypothetical protein